MKLVVDGTDLSHYVRIDELTPGSSDLAQQIGKISFVVRDPGKVIPKIPAHEHEVQLYDDALKATFGGYLRDLEEASEKFEPLGRAWICGCQSYDVRAYETETGSLSFPGQDNDRNMVIAIFVNALQNRASAPNGGTYTDAIVAANVAAGWPKVQATAFLSGMDFSYMSPKNAMDLISKYVPNVYWSIGPDRLLTYGLLRELAPYVVHSSPDRKGMRDYSVEVMADQPVGYWRLGEVPGSPVAADSSGNARHGSFVTATLGVEGGVPDGDTAASSAAGVNVASVPDHALLDLSAPCSWELLVKVAAKHGVYGYQPLNKWSSTLDANYALYFYGTPGDVPGGFQMYANRGGVWGPITGATADLTDGRWHHLAVTYSAANGGRIFVDGVQIGGAMAYAGVLTLNASAVTFGQLGGSIDEVAMYASELTPARVAAHALAAAARLMAMEDYHEQVFVGDHRNRMRRGGAAASEAIAYDEVSIARRGIVLDDPYKNDTLVPAADLRRRTYAELRGRRVRTVRYWTGYEGGVRAGHLIDVVNTRVGAGTRPAPFMASYASQIFGRSSTGRLAGERGRFLVQKVAEIPRGNGVYSYEFEAGDNVRDLPVQIAEISGAGT